MRTKKQVDTPKVLAKLEAIKNEAWSLMQYLEEVFGVDKVVDTHTWNAANKINAIAAVQVLMIKNEGVK